jgi:hypothetical protein
MTTYAAELGGPGTTVLAVGVKAGIYPIKILRVEMTMGTTTGTIPIITVYSSATLTAGSALTPFALRFGAPVASATARSGSPTGTATVLTSSVPFTGSAAMPAYVPPASLILPPGSAIGATSSSGNLGLIIIYFDELEIQPGY